MISHLIEIKKYEIKKSRNGLEIPVVNDVHIHSAYDPEKESEALFNQHADTLKGKSDILILGLGYGYHIQKMINYFIKNNRLFHIAVIEPNGQVIKDCLRFNPIVFKNVKTYCHISVDELFRSKNLMDFLLKKPVIIPHPPSFNLYRKYFTQCLTYKSKQGLEHTIDTFSDEEVRDYFKSYHQGLSITDCFKYLQKAKQFNKDIDFALTAFGELCEQSLKEGL